MMLSTDIFPEARTSVANYSVHFNQYFLEQFVK